MLTNDQRNMLLIINADDLGASEEVNDAVFELMGSGLVTSATLMSNGPAFSAAALRVKEYPTCSFGVHLNLTSFPPVSESKNLEPILWNGEFCRELLTDERCRKLRGELTQELTMQVEKVFDAGVPVSHFDSHHFIHLKPVLLPVIKRVQKRFGVRKFRSSFEGMSEKNMLYRLRGKCMDLLVRNFYRTTLPDGWCHFHNFQQRLPHLSSRYNTLELMVHPGSKNEFFEKEIQLLRSEWRRFLPPGTHLGNYNSLC